MDCGEKATTRSARIGISEPRSEVMEDTKDGPRRGTSGAVDAPNSGGRSRRAGTLNPGGECA
jgi:hypothetical protein